MSLKIVWTMNGAQWRVYWARRRKGYLYTYLRANCGGSQSRQTALLDYRVSQLFASQQDSTFLNGLNVAHSWANGVSGEMPVIDIAFGQYCNIELCTKPFAPFFGQNPIEFIF